jgi:hypothetical protein
MWRRANSLASSGNRNRGHPAKRTSDLINIKRVITQSDLTSFRMWQRRPAEEGGLDKETLIVLQGSLSFGTKVTIELRTAPQARLPTPVNPR